MVIKLVKPSHYAGWFGLLWLAILALTPKPFGQTNEVVFCATAPYLTRLCSPDARVTGYIVYVASLSSSLTPSMVLYFYVTRPALGGASGFGFVVK